jgi:hypothetical protein
MSMPAHQCDGAVLQRGHRREAQLRQRAQLPQLPVGEEVQAAADHGVLAAYRQAAQHPERNSRLLGLSGLPERQAQYDALAVKVRAFCEQLDSLRLAPKERA